MHNFLHFPRKDVILNLSEVGKVFASKTVLSSMDDSSPEIFVNKPRTLYEETTLGVPILSSARFVFENKEDFLFFRNLCLDLENIPVEDLQPVTVAAGAKSSSSTPGYEGYKMGSTAIFYEKEIAKKTKKKSAKKTTAGSIQTQMRYYAVIYSQDFLLTISSILKDKGEFISTLTANFVRRRFFGKDSLEVFLQKEKTEKISVALSTLESYDEELSSKYGEILPEFFSYTNISGQRAKAAVEKLREWISKQNSLLTETEWAECPESVTDAIYSLCLSAISVDEIVAGVTVENEDFNFDSWTRAIKEFNFQQNTERSRLNSLDLLERKKYAEAQGIPLLLTESRYREKTKEIVLAPGSRSRVLLGYFIPGRTALGASSTLGFEIKILGKTATDCFWKIASFPEAVAILIWYQIEMALLKALPNSVVFDKLREFTADAMIAGKKLFPKGRQDADIISFRNALETLERVLRENPQRANLFAESIGFFLFHRFFPTLENQRFFTLPQKFQNGIEIFVKRAAMSGKSALRKNSRAYQQQLYNDLKKVQAVEQNKMDKARFVSETELVKKASFVNLNSFPPFSAVFEIIAGRLTAADIGKEYNRDWGKFLRDIEDIEALFGQMEWSPPHKAYSNGVESLTNLMHTTRLRLEQALVQFRTSYLLGKAANSSDRLLYFMGIESAPSWAELKEYLTFFKNNEGIFGEEGNESVPLAIELLYTAKQKNYTVTFSDFMQLVKHLVEVEKMNPYCLSALISPDTLKPVNEDVLYWFNIFSLFLRSRLERFYNETNTVPSHPDFWITEIPEAAVLHLQETFGTESYMPIAKKLVMATEYHEYSEFCNQKGIETPFGSVEQSFPTVDFRPGTPFNFEDITMDPDFDPDMSEAEMSEWLSGKEGERISTSSAGGAESTSREAVDGKEQSSNKESKRRRKSTSSVPPTVEDVKKEKGRRSRKITKSDPTS